MGRAVEKRKTKKLEQQYENGRKQESKQAKK